MANNLTPSGIIGDMGVALARFRCGQMGLIFREKPTHDYGIDAEIEVIEEGVATGRLISAQIKCGDSFFSEIKDEKIVFRFNSRHYDYWTDHSLPVIAILVDHMAEQCFWGVISKSNVVSTGADFKVEISKSQKLELSSRSNLVDLATPMLSSADFEVVGERDQSHGDKRRLEYKICLNPTERPWTRASIKQLILQQTARARTSRYFRSELVEEKFGDQSVNLVWVYVYQSEGHIDKGAYIARALWTDRATIASDYPKLTHGEQVADGVRVEWNESVDQIIKALDGVRRPKNEYIAYAEAVLRAVEGTIKSYHYQAPMTESTLEPSEVLNGLNAIGELPEEVVPPTECDRLDQRIEELLALIGNARIYAVRAVKEPSKAQIHQMRRSIDDAFLRLIEANYELRSVR